MEYIIIGILLVGIILYLNYKKKLRLKREEEERQRIAEEKKRIEELALLHDKQRKELSPFLAKIVEFNVLFEKFKSQPKYISNFEIFNFKKETAHYYNSIKSKEYKHLPNFETSIKKINSFKYTFESIDTILTSRNENFIESELKNTDSLLSDVEGKSLDTQQRKAVIIDEDNQLVIAGAGSGKTTTIAGKVKYLTTIQNINPQSILLISFTRKAADEMRDRIFNKMNIDIPVKTFNKLGLDIIAQVNNLKPSIYDANGKSHLERISSFIDHAKESEEYYNLLIDFISYYLKPYKDIAEFETDAEHNNYLNEQKLEGYKMVEKRRSNGQIIRYRERLKSQEEVFIANFLFRNGINYEYEEKYQYKTASKQFGQYKPDFYLPDYNVYIEHFGVDENWNVPDWFNGKDGKSAKEVYNEGIEWKRQEHNNNSTILVESYSWQQRKGILLSELKKNLEDVGVVFNPISNDKLWLYLKENASKDISDFTQLLDTFLVLLKSNNEDISNLQKRALKEDNDRAIKFLELFDPIYHSYQEYLSEEEEIDFSDMINNATDIIQDNLYQSPYDYIIIDEYQDISKARFQLIKSLLDQKPSTKLFCVGDDWQSIYRFAGSDIGLFTNFEKHFKSSTVKDYNRVTQTSFIEYTYRFDNQLIDLSSNFILKNPNQISKKLKSHHKSEKVPYSIFKHSDPDRKSKNLHLALRGALVDIAKKSDNEDVSVLLLGRYDFERKNFINGSFLIERYNKISNQYEYICNEFPNLKIRFLTAHRSKGLENDYVIITNCSSGTYGFPSEISDDPLLIFLLSKADQFPNGEERRLFYVAMTRAKKHVSFLVNNDYTSKFIDEIEANEKITAVQCDWCDNGKLIERNGKFGYFYACNNSHYCNYTRKITANDFEVLADEYYKKEEFTLAIEYFEKYLSLEEGNSNSYYCLGRSYEQKSDLKNALINYEKAISKDSSNAYAYYWCGSVQFDLEDYNKAVESWLVFNKLKPNSNSVNYWLSQAYFKSRHFYKALHHINLELKENSTNTDAQTLKKQYTIALEKRYTTKETSIKSSDLDTIKGYLQLAVDFNVNVKFNYHKSQQFEGGVQSLRTIKPKGFKVMGQYNSVCVFGYCYMREEERTFKLERISDLKINPNKIEYWSE
ncbi:UvrD-helicase domain-containing protein [Zobellia russellii]|uniref:UvrD-helicase domain-containing protein n=1 Tax=Zobellia russellii TaxID=248907 RepID=UPI0037DC9D50